MVVDLELHSCLERSLEAGYEVDLEDLLINLISLLFGMTRYRRKVMLLLFLGKAAQACQRDRKMPRT